VYCIVQYGTVQYSPVAMGRDWDNILCLLVVLSTGMRVRAEDTLPVWFISYLRAVHVDLTLFRAFTFLWLKNLPECKVEEKCTAYSRSI
jgi:hypothetical protein